MFNRLISLSTFGPLIYLYLIWYFGHIIVLSISLWAYIMEFNCCEYAMYHPLCTADDHKLFNEHMWCLARTFFESVQPIFPVRNIQHMMLTSVALLLDWVHNCGDRGSSVIKKHVVALSAMRLGQMDWSDHLIGQQLLALFLSFGFNM